MKKYIYLLVALCFMMTQSLSAQSNERVKKENHSITNNILQYDIPIDIEGIYSVVIISPSGEILSWPVKNQKKTRGSKVDFTVNSKFWTSGDYRLQLLHDERIVDTYTISVGLSNRQKARLKNNNQ